MERLMVTLYDVTLLGDFVQLLRQQETTTLVVNMARPSSSYPDFWRFGVLARTAVSIFDQYAHRTLVNAELLPRWRCEDVKSLSEYVTYRCIVCKLCCDSWQERERSSVCRICFVRNLGEEKAWHSLFMTRPHFQPRQTRDALGWDSALTPSLAHPPSRVFLDRPTVGRVCWQRFGAFR